MVILGATGDTGKPLLRQTLDRGHTVTAIVRDPAKLTVVHPNLKTVRGDVCDSASLAPHFKDQGRNSPTLFNFFHK
jgi:putative NADH-flavin reductase